jgi:hypothetical protein
MGSQDILEILAFDPDDDRRRPAVLHDDDPLSLRSRNVGAQHLLRLSHSDGLHAISFVAFRCFRRTARMMTRLASPSTS